MGEDIVVLVLQQILYHIAMGVLQHLEAHYEVLNVAWGFSVALGVTLLPALVIIDLDVTLYIVWCVGLSLASYVAALMLIALLERVRHRWRGY